MLARFDRPVKRVGLLVLLAGLLLLMMALVGLLDYSIQPLIEHFGDGPLEALRTWRRGYPYGWSALSLWLAVPMVVTGAVLAFAYDATLGRLARWVQTGQ